MHNNYMNRFYDSRQPRHVVHDSFNIAKIWKISLIQISSAWLPRYFHQSDSPPLNSGSMSAVLAGGGSGSDCYLSACTEVVWFKVQPHE